MYRSPIAAEIFRGLLLRDKKRKNWKVSSAGTWTTEGRSAPQDAVEIAKSLGVDLSSHQTRMVNTKILEETDLIIVMEAGHKEALQVEFPFTQNKTYTLTYVLRGIDYDIADPAISRGETQKILQGVADMIHNGYIKICKLAE
jgi:protein-tyrosine phosphatase